MSASWISETSWKWQFLMEKSYRRCTVTFWGGIDWDYAGWNDLDDRQPEFLLDNQSFMLFLKLSIYIYRDFTTPEPPCPPRAYFLKVVKLTEWDFNFPSKPDIHKKGNARKCREERWKDPWERKDPCPRSLHVTVPKVEVAVECLIWVSFIERRRERLYNRISMESVILDVRSQVYPYYTPFPSVTV